MKKFIRSIKSSEHSYSFNGMRYTVSSMYRNPGDDIFAASSQIPARIDNLLKSSLIDLNLEQSSDIMAGKYACLAARKED